MRPSADATYQRTERTCSLSIFFAPVAVPIDFLCLSEYLGTLLVPFDAKNEPHARDDGGSDCRREKRPGPSCFGLLWGGQIFASRAEVALAVEIDWWAEASSFDFVSGGKDVPICGAMGVYQVKLILGLLWFDSSCGFAELLFDVSPQG